MTKIVAVFAVAALTMWAVVWLSLSQLIDTTA